MRWFVNLHTKKDSKVKIYNINYLVHLISYLINWQSKNKSVFFEIFNILVFSYVSIKIVI